jgi:zinc/manganese transport system substrate-binding protein
MNKLVLVMAFAAAVLVPALANAEPLKVVTTFSILGDITKQVGGDLVDVRTLVGLDEDAHAFNPTPQDSKALAQADIVVENGLGFEGWMDRLVTASGFKGARVVASHGIVVRKATDGEHDHEDHHEHGHEGADPHAWQDVGNARVYAANIAASLVKALPAQASEIKARATAYDAELKKLDAWIKAELAQFAPAQRKIITSHDAFGYFEAAYGVNFLAPQGISSEVEPSARQVAKLVEQMKSENIRRVFFESMTNPRLISRLAKDAGATVGAPVYSDSLSAQGGPASTYGEMMRYNVEQFKEAMALNGK